MARIVLQEVTKRFGKDVVAVDRVSMEIADGEFMVLVGPSGCGKTTLLRIIAGLEEVSDGEVVIGERIVTDLAPKHRDIAMVFQNYALYPHMTVAQNIAIGLRLRKRPKAEVAEKVREAASVLGLAPLLDRKPSELSGGQRQRVAMGRAMVREPHAFLMDEPLSNLDAKLRVQMRAELARLRDQLGTTTVYVTHDQVEAMTLGDRVAVMRDGVVQQLDTPQNLYTTPVNMFVAAFIGSPSMNLFEATIEHGQVVFGGHRLPVTDRLAGHSGPVVVGIRPSDFEDAEVWRDDTRAVLDVPVRVVEELGAEANVIFALDARPASDTADGRTPQEEGGEEAQVPLVADAGTTVCTACVDARTRARAGERVRLSVDPARLHFFEHGSGRVLAGAAAVPAAASPGGLSLHAGQGDPLDEHPLGEEEDHDHRQHEDERGRHRQVPVDVVHRAERRQRDRERLRLRVPRQVDERAVEIVPGVDEVEERHGGDRRLRERDDHPAQDLEVAAAVDAHRVGQLLRDRHEELAQQEDRERIAEEARDDQRLQRADVLDVRPVVVLLGPEDVERHGGHLRRHHQRRQHEQHDDVPAAPLDAGEGVGDRHRRDHDADRREPGVEERVPGVTGQVDAREHGLEVRPHERVRDDARRERLLVGHERRQEHEDDRQGERQRDRDQHGVVGHGEQQPPAADRGRQLTGLGDGGYDIPPP